MEKKEIHLIDINRHSPRKVKISSDRRKKLKKIKRRVAGGTAAGVMAAGLLVNGLFENPSDMMRRTNQALNQPAIVQTIDMDVDEDVADENKKNKTAPAKTGGFFAGVRQWIMNLPTAVKAIVGVPLWAIGWVGMQALTLVFGKLLGPVWGTVLKWLIGFLILAAIFVIIMKMIFPNAKIKDILKPRNLLPLLIGAVILGLADILVPVFWADFVKWRWLILFGGGLVTLAAAGLLFAARQHSSASERT